MNVWTMGISAFVQMKTQVTPVQTYCQEIGFCKSRVTTVYTDLPAYSDTVYSDTLLTVTLVACPK